jgi:hypothetical protein
MEGWWAIGVVRERWCFASPLALVRLQLVRLTACYGLQIDGRNFSRIVVVDTKPEP